MSYVTWSIVRTPFVDGAWDSAQQETLTTYYDPLVQKESGESRDSFSFKVTNFNGNFSDSYNPQDRIEIYRVVNSATVSASDLLIAGAVQDVPEQDSSGINLLRVEGYNYSEAVMSSLVFYDATNDTIPAAIQGALTSVAVFNDRFTITWHPDNPSTTSSGGVFPTVGERFFYRPLRDIIEKYSRNTATSDGTYYWYVDSQNRLVWRRAASTTSYSFNSATDTYRGLKLGKDTKEVKNYIIAKGGVDPEGKAIQARRQDYSSISKHGMKFYMLTDTAKLGGTLHTSDCQTAAVQHMRDAVYPFTTTAWKSLVTGTYITFADYDEYVEALRAHVLEVLKREADKMLEATSKGRLKVDLDFAPGVKEWGLGDLLSVTIASLGTAKKLRVRGIQYSTTSDSFTLEEDIGSGSL